MTRNFLQLNENKTEVIMFCHPTSVTSLSNALANANLHNVVKNLGVFLDTLNFNKQVSCIVKGSFNQLRTLAKLKPILSQTGLFLLLVPGSGTVSHPTLTPFPPLTILNQI